MRKLIKEVKVCYPRHELDGKTIDLLIENGIITSIGAVIQPSENDTIVHGDELILLPGLVDMQCTIGEPGIEHKEDLESASAAAQAGGFKTIVMLPTTDPVIDSKSQLTGIKNQCKDLPTSILAYGALSKSAKGVELSEMFDLKNSGAVAFSDGKNPISDSNMMKRALEYARNFDGIVCSLPLDERINPGGMVHESLNTLQLGLKQNPAIAEELMLVRDLYLAQYTHSKLHVSTISTKNSVSLIKQYKEKGVKVTCGVALANLLYTDGDLNGFDSNFKTMPPLRGREDQEALIQGVKSGIIDVIVTDHTPENIENKDREFDHASFGMTMLETAMSMMNESLTELKWSAIAQSMSLKPRELLGIDLPELKQGAAFDFTLFDPKQSWTYSDENRKSKSTNTPCYNQELIGRVIPI